MEKSVYEAFLKKSGRKAEVIEKYARFIKEYGNYLSREKNKSLAEAVPADLDDYYSHYEHDQSMKTKIYAILLYYKAIGNKAMLAKATELRQIKKSKKKPMLLKNILDINSEFIEKLKSTGITDVVAMLKEGRTKQQRKELSRRLEIPYETVLELVKISDLTRIGYVKSKLTRLYYDAGIQTPGMMKKWQAEDLREHFANYIQESGWEGMVPNLVDLQNNIENAKKIPDLVEYENGE
ncbi:MAG: DUF4332 domain-containing protein [Candidatus Odinarchaeota archaeon]